MEEVVERALNVVKSNEKWVDFIKNFNEPNGFMFCDSPELNIIKDAVDEENPIHSGASIALCLQECKHLLNMT